MRIISAEQASNLIQSKSTVTVGGFGHCGSPEALLKALRERFDRTKTPIALKLIFTSGVGNRDGSGLDRLAVPGLLAEVIGGYWSLAPEIGDLARNEQLLAYNWPQGIISQLFRATASGARGLLSAVGLNTFVDPTFQGGALNQKTPVTTVQRLKVNGYDQLYYPTSPIQFSLLRGTLSDEKGNISMDREAVLGDCLSQAQATRNSGGINIVQVADVVRNSSINPSAVKIPAALVDYVVVADAADHRQTSGEAFNERFRSASQSVIESRPTFKACSVRRIVARRAAIELLKLQGQRFRFRPIVVNLGIGTPTSIADELRDTRSDKNIVLTLESGVFGGYPASNASFGASEFPEAVLSQVEQFDFYDGGGIDLAFLGFGEVDRHGCINVCKLGERIHGIGGFVNISQRSKQIVFCGSFNAGGTQFHFSAEKGVDIKNEGSVKKFVGAVGQICFDPRYRELRSPPLLVTERAVFQLVNGGLVMTEIAPGCRIREDVLAQSDFDIAVSPEIVQMPSVCFEQTVLSDRFES